MPKSKRIPTTVFTRLPFPFKLETSASTAKNTTCARDRHADRRHSFNQRYEDVMKAAGALKHAADPGRNPNPNAHFDGHVKQATFARSSHVNYTKLQKGHEKYMHT
jgi:hypothetical protein